MLRFNVPVVFDKTVFTTFHKKSAYLVTDRHFTFTKLCQT